MWSFIKLCDNIATLMPVVYCIFTCSHMYSNTNIILLVNNFPTVHLQCTGDVRASGRNHVKTFKDGVYGHRLSL